jgi:glycosyltransferase involved in cell wall biosynthesis
VSASPPEFVVVMIFLDAEDYLDEAIRSVLGQDTDEFELVLVDDGSSDASTEIAQRWATADPRVSYLDHPGHSNLGMSASRIRGVEASVAPWICFLDADDVLLPSALSHRRALAERHPDADVIVTGTWFWRGWTGDPADEWHDHEMPLPTLERRTVLRAGALFDAMYGDPAHWRVLSMCGLTIRRSWWQRTGGMDPAFRGLFEDQVLYARIGLHAAVVIDDRPIALYRQHDRSACAIGLRNGEWAKHEPSPAELRFLTWLDAEVRQVVPDDTRVREVVDANLRRATSWHGHRATLLRGARAAAGRIAPASVRTRLRSSRVKRWKDPAWAVESLTARERWVRHHLAVRSDATRPPTPLTSLDVDRDAVLSSTSMSASMVPFELARDMGLARLRALLRSTPDEVTLHAFCPGPDASGGGDWPTAAEWRTTLASAPVRADIQRFGNARVAPYVDDEVRCHEGCVVDDHRDGASVMIAITVRGGASDRAPSELPGAES